MMSATTSTRLRPLWSFAGAVVVVAVVCAAASSVHAHASTLGGAATAELFSTTVTSVTVPSPPGGHFPFDTPGSLDGVWEVNGWRWVVHTGTYTSNGTTLTAGPARAVATMGTGSAHRSAVVHLADTSGNRSGGVAANVNAAGTQFVAAVTENPNGGRVRLLLVDGATVLELAQVRGVGTPDTVGITFDGHRWVVSVNGTAALTHTATAHQLPLLGHNTRLGVFNNSNTRPTYTAFELR